MKQVKKTKKFLKLWTFCRLYSLFDGHSMSVWNCIKVFIDITNHIKQCSWLSYESCTYRVDKVLRTTIKVSYFIKTYHIHYFYKINHVKSCDDCHLVSIQSKFCSICLKTSSSSIPDPLILSMIHWSYSLFVLSSK